jgi:hypothetical protein
VIHFRKIRELCLPCSVSSPACPGMIWLVLRRVVPLFVVVAIGAGGVTVAVARSVSPGSQSAPTTKAEADAFARAVNLRASDLPGATAIRGAIFDREAVQYEALRCGRRGTAGEAPVGGGESWLNNTNEDVASIVEVAPSPHLAETELAALGSRRGRTCLTRALGRALSFELHGESEWSHAVKVTFVPVAELIGNKALAIHVIAKLPPIEEENPPPKPPVRYITVDGAFFRVGPAEVAFFVLGNAPLPQATEDRLLALLHSRAEAHRL